MVPKCLIKDIIFAVPKFNKKDTPSVSISITMPDSMIRKNYSFDISSMGGIIGWDTTLKSEGYIEVSISGAEEILLTLFVYPTEITRVMKNSVKLKNLLSDSED